MLDIERTKPAVTKVTVSSSADNDLGNRGRGFTAEPFLGNRVLFQFFKAVGVQTHDMVLTAGDCIELGQALNDLGNQAYLVEDEDC